MLYNEYKYKSILKYPQLYVLASILSDILVLMA